MSQDIEPIVVKINDIFECSSKAQWKTDESQSSLVLKPSLTSGHSLLSSNNPKKKLIELSQVNFLGSNNSIKDLFLFLNQQKKAGIALHRLRNVLLIDSVPYIEMEEDAADENNSQSIGVSMMNQSLSSLVSAPNPEKKMLMWNFHDLNMAMDNSLDILQVSNRDVLVKQLDISERLELSACLDMYLDNIMANIPELALELHSRGLVRGVKMLNIEDLPFLTPDDILSGCDVSESSAQKKFVLKKDISMEIELMRHKEKSIPIAQKPLFDPKSIEFDALAILRFLQENCRREDSSYLLQKSKSGNHLILYDLSSAPMLKQEKFKRMLLTISYRFAVKLTEHERQLGNMSDKVLMRNRKYQLLKICIQLLDELTEKSGFDNHESLRSSIFEMLGEIHYNHVYARQSPPKKHDMKYWSYIVRDGKFSIDVNESDAEEECGNSLSDECDDCISHFSQSLDLLHKIVSNCISEENEDYKLNCNEDSLSFLEGDIDKKPNSPIDDVIETLLLPCQLLSQSTSLLFKLLNVICIKSSYLHQNAKLMEAWEIIFSFTSPLEQWLSNMNAIFCKSRELESLWRNAIKYNSTKTTKVEENNKIGVIIDTIASCRKVILKGMSMVWPFIGDLCRDTSLKKNGISITDSKLQQLISSSFESFSKCSLYLLNQVSVVLDETNNIKVISMSRKDVEEVKPQPKASKTKSRNKSKCKVLQGKEEDILQKLENECQQSWKLLNRSSLSKADSSLLQHIHPLFINIQSCRNMFNSLDPWKNIVEFSKSSFDLTGDDLSSILSLLTVKDYDVIVQMKAFIDGFLNRKDNVLGFIEENDNDILFVIENLKLTSAMSYAYLLAAYFSHYLDEPSSSLCTKDATVKEYIRKFSSSVFSSAQKLMSIVLHLINSIVLCHALSELCSTENQYLDSVPIVFGSSSLFLDRIRSYLNMTKNLFSRCSNVFLEIKDYANYCQCCANMAALHRSDGVVSIIRLSSYECTNEARTLLVASLFAGIDNSLKKCTDAFKLLNSIESTETGKPCPPGSAARWDQSKLLLAVHIEKGVTLLFQANCYRILYLGETFRKIHTCLYHDKNLRPCVLLLASFRKIESSSLLDTTTYLPKTQSLMLESIEIFQLLRSDRFLAIAQFLMGSFYSNALEYQKKHIMIAKVFPWTVKMQDLLTNSLTFYKLAFDYFSKNDVGPNYLAILLDISDHYLMNLKSEMNYWKEEKEKEKEKEKESGKSIKGDEVKQITPLFVSLAGAFSVIFETRIGITDAVVAKHGYSMNNLCGLIMNNLIDVLSQTNVLCRSLVSEFPSEFMSLVKSSLLILFSRRNQKDCSLLQRCQAIAGVIEKLQQDSFLERLLKSYDAKMF